jgi:hypothetical protein
VPPTRPYVVAITLRFGKLLRLQGNQDSFARREEEETSASSPRARLRWIPNQAGKPSVLAQPELFRLNYTCDH